MDIRIKPQPLSGEVAAISSKSDVHRLLICAALSDAPTEVRFTTLSKDIAATMECLKALGATIEQRKDTWLVRPGGNTVHSTVLNCAESGSTLRFLIPVAAALGCETEFTGEGRLPLRPLGPLIGEMEKHGCRFFGQQLPIRMEGRLTPGLYELPGNISSQYITGLLLALPLLNGDSQIRLKTELESRPYVEMTIATLLKFGVVIETLSNGFAIAGNQTFRSPKSVQAEGDWSNAAFWLCAGAIGGPLTCRGLDTHSFQGDRKVLDLLQQFGARVDVEENAVTVTAGSLHGIEIDASAIPDLITALVVVAAAAKGTTTIHHAGRLRLKESDRLAALASYLSGFGVLVDELPEGLLIRGGYKLSGGEVDGRGDHRIVMSSAIASALCGGEVVIWGSEAVRKSYPHFFEDFLSLGGKAYVIHDRRQS